MATTKLSFTPSINIVRDSNYEFNYITTPNSISTLTSILNDVKIGTKAHLLIGAYGTGKSSFLLAFKQTNEGFFNHFKEEAKQFNSFPKYQFISLVGEYSSLEDVFAKRYELGNNYRASDIIVAIENEYQLFRKAGQGLAIIIDEFGKFLEYAANNNPESELYFIQMLAEWVNDTNNEALLIATLHQGFSNYSYSLNKAQQLEWDKVRGRLKDVPFNEPVEQLLFLAAERINQKFPVKTSAKNFGKLFDTIRIAKAFPLRDYFDIKTAEKLYPFDILSASILTLSLQRYAQNERSLFSFIESNDHLGISSFDNKKHLYYSIPQVYDYLVFSYYSFLNIKKNPNYQQWANIRNTLEMIDGLFSNHEQQIGAESIVKTIGLLNIFATGSAKLEPKFYINFCKLALGIKNPEEILRQLESKLIIRYVKHNFRYNFVGSTNLDIELAIDDAGKLVEKVTDVVHQLNQYFDFPFISAKASYYNTGTPRFFQFKLSEDPINLIPEGEVDGFINLIFSEDSNILTKVSQVSTSCNEAIVYGYYKNTADIRNLLYEIQKIEKVKETNKNDGIALRELQSIKDHYVQLLNHFVLDNLYNNNGNIVWYSQGKIIEIESRHAFNHTLSNLCNSLYKYTPIFRNELVNKTKVSSQVSRARKLLLERILTELDKANLGFLSTEFPPEKSIYLTLLRETGMHQINQGIGILQKPQNESFNELWLGCIQFLESTKSKERNLTELINILTARPFKLKQGFVDFWVPIFFIAKHDDFALYEGDTYIPDIKIDILELLNKKPGMFSVKAFDVAGVKLELFNRYRLFLNQVENHKPNNRTFIQTIKPFLAFYRELPEYAKKTNRIDKKTNNLRKVIATAKDPEKAFFEDFPTALGFSISDLQNKPLVIESYLKQLQESISELRTCYDLLIDRMENYLVKDLLGINSVFPDYRQVIRDRFKYTKNHLLLPHQKSFISRIQSELDDRKAWLASIAQVCIGKSFASINDEEEILLFDKLKNVFYELDNLSEIGKEQINSETEEVVKLEITTFVQGLKKNLLRIPIDKNIEIDNTISQIKHELGNDKKINIAALTKLLQELLTNE